MTLLDHFPAAFRSRYDASGREPRIVQQLQMPWAAGKLSAAARLPLRRRHFRASVPAILSVFSPFIRLLLSDVGTGDTV